MRTFTTTLVSDSRSRVVVPLPFNPDEVWGRKLRHHNAGTVNGMGVRGVVEDVDTEKGLVLGPAWRRVCGIGAGDEVTVAVAPEGPQRSDLAPDIAAALASDAAAGEFFDSLAQFYRNAYLAWIEATKRRPDLRASRIAEMVSLLKAGQKQRPAP